MRDKWVALYILLVLVQVPVYYELGKDSLGFDFAIKEAELKLKTPLVTKRQTEDVEEALEKAEQHLDRLPPSSRKARVLLNRGLLSWKKGKTDEAIESLEECLQVFDDNHGRDSFHSAAVDLRTAELLFLQGKFSKAQPRFHRSRGRVGEYLGVHTPFPVRMAFREVSSLVTLGRDGEAADIAKRFLPDLRRVASEQDVQFLRRTGQSLDMLALKGLVSGPPEGHKNWKQALTSVKKGAGGGHQELE